MADSRFPQHTLQVEHGRDANAAPLFPSRADSLKDGKSGQKPSRGSFCSLARNRAGVFLIEEMPSVRDKDQINLTDEESRIMPVSGGGFEQAYNAQAVVDNETLLIVSNHVSQKTNDKKELTPALSKRRSRLCRSHWDGPKSSWPTMDTSVSPMSRVV